MSRLEGDITVKQLTEVETGQILAEDYQYAQDEFRKVSKFKKVVDSKRPQRASWTSGRGLHHHHAAARTSSKDS